MNEIHSISVTDCHHHLAGAAMRPYLPVTALLLFCAAFFTTDPVFAQESASEVSTLYELNSGDQLRIQVYNEQDLYRETRVDDRGMISYPFLGEINVRGMTASELEQFIASGLKGEYLIHPKVSVDILQYRLFYINGEVEEPGGFPYQPGLTVRKAISIAGGFKERASADKVYVVRDGASEDDPIRVRLDDLINPGDIITVEQSFF